MLDHIRYIRVRSIDPGRSESFIEYAPSRANEGFPLEILIVAGLFSHQKNSR
jgi:hypothetical protein